MVPGGIPAWNAHGVLPPTGVDPTSPLRSPYVVPLTQFVSRFGISSERLTILDGLLRYRAALQTLGLTTGFQWLDGSFLENVETMDARPPNDVDVVTFFRLPPGASEISMAQRAPQLFDHRAVKEQFLVDAYLENLGLPSEGIVERATYWYSMWSHRRDGTWKGFVRVGLAADEDVAAQPVLTSLIAAGVQP